MSITGKSWKIVSEREKAKRLYLSAFPKEERLPDSLLSDGSHGTTWFVIARK